MIDIVYLTFVCLAFLIAVGDWRRGIYLCLLVDVIRDPVRKLTEDQSVLITVAASGVWFGVILGALRTHSRELIRVFQLFPSIRSGLQTLIVAILPGAALSILLYSGGYKLAVIGAASYLVPMAGLGIGWLFARSEAEIERILKFYSLVNAAALIGTVLEYVGYDIPGLGGLKMDWIRYESNYVVQLIGGFYRSPDIMGLHAAHVTVFSLILARRSRGTAQAGWIGVALWAALCLLLSGRRKMIAIPIVFVASYLILSIWRGSHTVKRALGLAAIGLVVGGFVVYSAREIEVSHEYTDYASTLVTQGTKRTSEIIGGSVLGTLSQSGMLGSGLGSATQGRGYAGVKSDYAWQEDGASRLFKELGVPGVVFVVVTLYLFFIAFQRAIRLVPVASSVQDLQIALLAVVLGNAASFLASHQQYSGDPAGALFVIMLGGCVLGMPCVTFAQRARRAAIAPRLEKSVHNLAFAPQPTSSASSA